MSLYYRNNESLRDPEGERICNHQNGRGNHCNIERED